MDDIEIPTDEEIIELRESQWRRGFHTDRDGNEISLTHMSNKYLENVIGYFGECDTEALQKELNKRINANKK